MVLFAIVAARQIIGAAVLYALRDTPLSDGASLAIGVVISFWPVPVAGWLAWRWLQKERAAPKGDPE